MAVKGLDASAAAKQTALAIIQLLCEDGPLLHSKVMTGALGFFWKAGNAQKNSTIHVVLSQNISVSGGYSTIST